MAGKRFLATPPEASRRGEGGVSLDTLPDDSDSLESVLDLRDDRAPAAQATQRVADGALIEEALDPRAGRLSTRFSVAALVAVDAAAVAVAGVAGGVAGSTALAYGLAALAVLALAGEYRSRLNPTLAEGLPALVAVLATPLLAVGALPSVDPAALLRFAPIVIASVAIARGVAYSALRTARRRGVLAEPTLIIGAGEQGRTLARTIRDHPEYGLVPIGFLDAFDDAVVPPILGDVDALDVVLREFGVRRVIVAYGGTREPDLVRILRSCDSRGVEVHVLPRFFELGLGLRSPDVDDVWGIPLVRLRRAALRTAAWRCKRVFDIVASLAALLLFLPVMVVTALAVKVSSRGPVLFRQRRIGQDGREIDVFKFRSMRENDEADTRWGDAEDDRITSVGRIIRKTSIDELPQIWNVLRGEMSLVGPRPERPHFVEKFGEGISSYGDRHRVPGGITGWAQVHRLRGDTSIAERARFDNNYIEHWSLWRDIVILVRTVRAALQGDPK